MNPGAEIRLARYEAQEEALMKRNAAYSRAQHMYHAEMKVIEEMFEEANKEAGDNGRM